MPVAGIAAVKNADVLAQKAGKLVNSLQILPRKTILDSTAIPADNPSFYIFNYEGGGYAIVSADKRVQPILAYSDKGYLKNSGDISPGAGNWLTVTHKNMQLVRANHTLKAPHDVSKMWALFTATTSAKTDLKIQHEAPPVVCIPYDWPDVVANLDNHWSVILTASTDNHSLLFWSWYKDGHTWVCDGYNEYQFFTCETPTSEWYGGSSYLFLHMNWGWDGNSNGDYAYNAWNVLNGTMQYYQYNQQMDYNIHP